MFSAYISPIQMNKYSEILPLNLKIEVNDLITLMFIKLLFITRDHVSP